MTTETETVDIQHEYLTDATFVPRMARVYTAFSLARPTSVAAISVVTVLGLVALVLGLIAELPIIAVAGAVYVLIGPISGALIYLRTRRGNARRLPVGSRIGIGLGETMIRTEGPFGSSTTSYAAFAKAFRQGDFVILRLQGLRAYSILPSELFPGAEFETLRERIARANA